MARPMSQFIRFKADLTEEQHARMFDAVDWYLVLYDNKTNSHDDTIRAIVNSVLSIAEGPKLLNPTRSLQT